MKIWKSTSGEQKIGCAVPALHVYVPDFRLAGQKVCWLWENPWKIVAEKTEFLEMSCDYEKVRTFFKEKYH